MLRVSSLDLYLAEIRRFPLLDAQREAELGKLARSGDREAVCELVRSNLRFVVHLALRYRYIGVPLMDLIQEGNVALIVAASKFDPDKGLRFLSFASVCIRRAICVALARMGRSVCIPPETARQARMLAHLRMKLEQQLGRKPTQIELAQLTGLGRSRVEELSTVGTPELSLDAPVFDGEDDTTSGDRFADVALSTEGAAQHSDGSMLAAALRRAVSELSPRDADMLRRLYGFDGEAGTLDEVADQLALSRERVRQIRDRALLRLRRSRLGMELLEA